MKAIVYHKYGTIKNLKLEEKDVPVPKDNEVLIKVKACAINDWDWGLLHGTPLIIRPMFGLFKPRKATILGCDVAGVVEKVGKSVTKFNPGDAVLGDLSNGNFGGFADYTIANEDELCLKPKKLTFEEAAALPHAGLLAYQSFFDYMKLEPGMKVLINGAGGGVGTIGIPILKSIGIEVTGVDAPEKHELMIQLGADHVVNYKTEDFSALQDKFDLIVDNKVSRKIKDYKNVMKKDGIVLMVGGHIPRVFKNALLGLLFKRKPKTIILAHKPNKYLKELLNLCVSGTTKPIIDKVFSLEQMPQALQKFGEGKLLGKGIISLEK
jgi:NADPH:quinone reductase-like Zn-dependent oxidoreductase